MESCACAVAVLQVRAAGIAMAATYLESGNGRPIWITEPVLVVLRFAAVKAAVFHSQEIGRSSGGL